MRPRKKKHGQTRIDACHALTLESPETKKGKLKEEFPCPAHPLHLELGCGKGRFVTTLAQLHPELNYIAFEREPDVIVSALELAQSLDLQNIRFVIGDATALPALFLPNEVSMIYINFCDPWHKNRHATRRLTYREHLERYKKVLCEGGEIHFKTDDQNLYHFSLWEFKAALELIGQTLDLHHDPILGAGNIMTEYEERFAAQGMKIHSLWGRKNSAIISKTDLPVTPLTHAEAQ